MQTTQLINASAEVVTITSVRPGDVYKRLDESAYGGPTLQFGVVTDVMHNGTEGAIVAVEYRLDHTGLNAAQKVFAQGKAAALFAAQPDEVTVHLTELRDAAEKRVRDAEEALVKARATLDLVAGVEARVAAAGLTAPATVRGELTEAQA